MAEALSAVSKEHPGYAGQAVYKTSFLRIYDLFVVGFSNRVIYRCPSRRFIDLYDRYAGRRHLDLGPGTGYFLSHCKWSDGKPELTLADLNPDVLRYSAHRLRKYEPTVVQADILQPLPFPDGSFDSVGINFLLHCMPGPMREKGRVFTEAARLLRPGGMLFGSTVIQDGGNHWWFARMMMGIYNRSGILSTTEDSLTDLKKSIAAGFDDYQVEVRGSVAVFTATRS
ncbi:MAG TPA: class I SAM-dependent methyltransferase [Kribbella sp.]|uniref:class I SAM-dependent methyltransferase n=1 Tax=Kribbella sp. TaxID=1871183 RepID=UPI002D769541|nr:class I SAM-dependent methyltransferase [Kribbella sp.]HET6298481.1 class I SAM-dependent methyltransferase [Kribbella sp.]